MCKYIYTWFVSIITKGFLKAVWGARTDRLALFFSSRIYRQPGPDQALGMWYKNHPKLYTLPETHMFAPENGWLEYYIYSLPFGAKWAYFQLLLLLVLGRVTRGNPQKSSRRIGTLSKQKTLKKPSCVIGVWVGENPGQ